MKKSLIALLLLVAPISAYATYPNEVPQTSTCYSTPVGGQQYQVVDWTLSSFNPVISNANLNGAIGTVLYSQPVTVNGSPYITVLCRASTGQLGNQIWMQYPEIGLVGNVGVVFDTGIPGIGIQIVDPVFTLPPSTVGLWGFTAASVPYYSPPGWTNPIQMSNGGSWQVTARLIKTGTITRGGTLPNYIGKFDFVTNGVVNAMQAARIVWGGDVIVNPGFPTCSVIGSDTVSVTLPSLKSSDFSSSPNPSAGNSTPITLTVGNCQDANTATFTFSGDDDSVNPVLFKNTGGATGVAVRLYPTSDNTQTIGANGTNNVFPVQITGGQASLSVGAQYYKTGATVGSGSVVSKATVIMSYN